MLAKIKLFSNLSLNMYLDACKYGELESLYHFSHLAGFNPIVYTECLKEYSGKL